MNTALLTNDLLHEFPDKFKELPRLRKQFEAMGERMKTPERESEEFKDTYYQLKRIFLDETTEHPKITEKEELSPEPAGIAGLGAVTTATMSKKPTICEEGVLIV